MGFGEWKQEDKEEKEEMGEMDGPVKGAGERGIEEYSRGAGQARADLFHNLLRRGVLPVVGVERPHDYERAVRLVHPIVELGVGVAVGRAHRERRVAREGGDGLAGALKLREDLFPGHLGQDGVIPHVVANLVALEEAALEDGTRVRQLRLDAHDVEGGLGLLGLEDVEQAGSEVLVRAVVEGDGHELFLGRQRHAEVRRGSLLRAQPARAQEQQERQADVEMLHEAQHFSRAGMRNSEQMGDGTVQSFAPRDWQQRPTLMRARTTHGKAQRDV